MKIVDKYIFGQFIVPFIYCLLAFSMLFVIADLFDHLSDFIEARTPLPDVLRYYLFVMPSLLVYIVPISLLLGLLYSLWQLSRHNELTALRACGVSFYRIAAPILLVGLVVSMLISVLQETVAPHSTYWAWQFVNQQKKSGDFAASHASDLPYKNDDQRRIWLIRRFDLANYDMQGVRVVQQRPDGSDMEVVLAEEAKFFDGRWWLFNMSVQKYDFYNNPVGAPTHEPLRQMVEWNETPDDFMHEVKNMEFLSARDLGRFLATRKNLSDKTRARILVDLHARLAMPWTCLVVVLFGIPFGVRTARRGALIGVIFALLTFFSFYFLMTFGQWLGKEQFLVPVVSAWMPNIFFLLLGSLLMLRTR
ncbi:MAG: LptF/LptG family permease [Kiritimatiellae bacterium]|nr:LptF/LptG family permease [Kiritimatiellia bacterium]